MGTRIGDKIKYYRELIDLTQEELAERVGYKSRSAIAKIELGIRDINQSQIAEFAKALEVTPSKLMGWDEEAETTTTMTIYDIKAEPRRIPILGAIHCGEPMLAVEEYDEWFDIDKSIKADFALRVKGDSMIGADIHDGDIAFFISQQTLENGEIGAFIIDDSATLKRYKIINGVPVLKPANDNYADINLTPDSKVRTIGRLVGVYSEKKR